MTSAVGNNNHLSYCSILESETPVIAFKSTIDFNTQAAVPYSPKQKVQITTHQKEKEHILSLSPLRMNWKNWETIPPLMRASIQEYMHWHYRLNHASFPTMLHMEKLKHLPQGISSILRRMERHHHKPPLCSNCIASKMCRKQWRK